MITKTITKTITVNSVTYQYYNGSEIQSKQIFIYGKTTQKEIIKYICKLFPDEKFIDFIDISTTTEKRAMPFETFIKNSHEV